MGSDLNMLGKNIARFRKNKHLTQEALAQLVGVSNQAVSKWEQDICCPDIALLPKLADLFDVSLDELFGRKCSVQSEVLPWDDDGVLRAVVYVGQKIVLGHEAGEKIEFCYEGPALNIESQFNVCCDSVGGNVHAGGNVTCDDVGGDIHAGINVVCDSAYGNVQAGANVTCDETFGDIYAGGNIYCDHAEGDITAKGTIEIG